MNIKKMNLILVALFLYSSCSHHQDLKSIKKFWTLSVQKSSLTDLDDKSRWTSSDATISFNGNIIEGDCNQFKNVAKPYHNTLQVNSQGGSVSEALCIANEMKRLKINKTIVNGLCWSSCANYLFLEASERVIERGSVGFHGNLTALFNQDIAMRSIRKIAMNQSLTDKDIKNIRSFFKSKSKGKHLSSNEIRKVNKFLKTTSKTLLHEKNFLKRNNITQEIFEVTQTPDKGNGDGMEYMFLIPSPDTFNQYGIQNISGENSKQFVKMVNERDGAILLYK